MTDDAGYGDFKTIWTQFTGLKDKNNREIYEGDIIKVNNKYNDTHSVKFDNGSFCIIADGDSQDNVLLSSVLECEIIGNIFENPDF